MRNIAIFASGSGTNAENIIRHFSTGSTARVALVLSNRADAYVVKRAETLGVPAIIFDRNDFYVNGRVKEILRRYSVDFIVLAGFLWLVPPDFISEYPGRIVNIHPALLPSYGGKGMYGEAVHRAVIEAGDMESGITIHYVNSVYDNGDIVFSAKCPVLPGDTAGSLAQRIHALEYEHYPPVIEKLVSELPDRS